MINQDKLPEAMDLTMIKTTPISKCTQRRENVKGCLENNILVEGFIIRIITLGTPYHLNRPLKYQMLYV